MELQEARLSILTHREKALRDTISWLTTHAAKTGIEAQLTQERLMLKKTREDIVNTVSELNTSIQNIRAKLGAFSPEMLEKEAGAKINTKTPHTDPLYQIRLRKVDLKYLESKLTKTLEQLKACDVAIEKANNQYHHVDVLSLKQKELEKVQAEIATLKDQLDIDPPERENTSPPIGYK